MRSPDVSIPGTSPRRTRAYRMVKRAATVDRTRERIAAATARLHTTVGPADASIAAVAQEAGVTRLTVYRHFPDLDTLFEACRAHWRAENPPPNAEAWADIDGLEARARRALGELYAWFREKAEQLFPIYRDLLTMPLSSQESMRADREWLAAIIGGPDLPSGAAGTRTLGVLRHLVDYRTWRSLAVDQGLTDGDVVELGIAMLLRASGESASE